MIPKLNIASNVKLKARVRRPGSNHDLGEDVYNLVLEDSTRIVQGSVSVFEKLCAVSVAHPMIQASVDNLIRVSRHSS